MSLESFNSICKSSECPRGFHASVLLALQARCHGTLSHLCIVLEFLQFDQCLLAVSHHFLFLSNSLMKLAWCWVQQALHLLHLIFQLLGCCLYEWCDLHISKCTQSLKLKSLLYQRCYGYKWEKIFYLDASKNVNREREKKRRDQRSLLDSSPGQ